MIHKNYYIIPFILFIIATFISCSPKNGIEKFPSPTSSKPQLPSPQSSKSTDIKLQKEIEKVSQLIRNGDLIEAEDLVNDIIKRDPGNFKAHFYRGVLHQKNIEFDKALSDYKEAVRLNPRDALTYAYTGRLLIVMRGGLKEAKENFDKALEIDPNNREAQMGVGMMYMFTEEYPKAKVFFDKLIESIPDKDSSENADLFQERGFAHYYVRDLKKAVEDFDRAIKIDPDNLNMTTNYAGRAMTYYRLGEPEKAVADLYRIKNDQEIVTLHSEYDELVQVIYYKGDLEKAFNLCRLAYKAFPSLYADVRRYGEMLDHFGKTSEAHKMFKKAMGIDPHNTQAYERMGYSFMVLGKIKEAESMFKKAVGMAGDRDSKNDAYIEYADFLIRTGRYNEAEKQLQKVVNSPDNTDPETLASAYLGMCNIKCFTGKLTEAKKYLDTAEKIDPGSIANKIHRVEILTKMKKHAEALSLLKKILPDKFQLWGDAYNVEMMMAETLFAMGKQEEGFHYLKRVFEKDYPSSGLFRLRFVIPQSPVFQKLRKDSKVKKFLDDQKERIFNLYIKGGRKPAEIEY